MKLQLQVFADRRMCLLHVGQAMACSRRRNISALG
jgi:hypothetical protein